MATGYRYFPSQGALLQAAVEASFSHLPENLFTGLDVMQRIDRLIDVAFPNIVEHELLDRAVLRLALDQWLKKKSGHALKEDEVQRHGRKPLVEQILEPLVGRVRRAQLERLRQGLGMILGMETFVALRDIYDLEPKQIGEVWRWACKALVENTLVEAEEARPGIAASSSSEV